MKRETVHVHGGFGSAHAPLATVSPETQPGWCSGKPHFHRLMFLWSWEEEADLWGSAGRSGTHVRNVQATPTHTYVQTHTDTRAFLHTHAHEHMYTHRHIHVSRIKSSFTSNQQRENLKPISDQKNLKLMKSSSDPDSKKFFFVIWWDLDPMGPHGPSILHLWAGFR